MTKQERRLRTRMHKLGVELGKLEDRGEQDEKLEDAFNVAGNYLTALVRRQTWAAITAILRKANKKIGLTLIKMEFKLNSAVGRVDEIELPEHLGAALEAIEECLKAAPEELPHWKSTRRKPKRAA